MPFGQCSRCARGPLPLDRDSICRFCQQGLARDVAAGLAQLHLYLAKRWRFANYLRAHGLDDHVT